MQAVNTAVPWNSYLSNEAHARKASSIKTLEQYVGDPDKIFLGSGQPSSDHFPIEVLDLTLSASASSGSGGASYVLSGRDELSEYKLMQALQYGQGQGSPQLLHWVREHTDIVHHPPYMDWNCVLSAGSTSALEMTFRMLCKPGDWILCEEFTYPIVMEIARPLGIKFAGVEVDDHGIVPSSLDQVMEKWNVTSRDGPKPSMLYMIPTGQNPTGSTQPLQRRQDVYAVAQKHGLLIIEDDPYYFLQTRHATTRGMKESPTRDRPSNDFLDGLVPSYLSLDLDGRVVRLDSFSKVVAPGCRVGWITAPEQVCACYRLHADISTQGPSGISQIVLFKLLSEYWGHSGYFRRLERLQQAYDERRALALEACTRHLPSEFMRCITPQGGLFLWMEIDLAKHPAFPVSTASSIEEDIYQRCLRHGVVLVKGSFFYAEPRPQAKRIFLRITYAAAPFTAIEEGCRRLGKAVTESFAVPNATPETMDNRHSVIASVM